jgi:hypothetical protein
VPTRRISVDSRLYRKLREVDKEACRKFPWDYDPGLGGLGLILLPRLDHFGYGCTPKNSLAFATTGGEGVHFSFLVAKSRVHDASPVICTIPEMFQNHIVGDNLFDFLCLGYHRGYFALEQLAYKPKKTLKVFGSGFWKPRSKLDWLDGFGVNQHQHEVLDFLIQRLGLKPWKGIERRFNRLQKKYLPLLEVPASIEDAYRIN